MKKVSSQMSYRHLAGVVACIVLGLTLCAASCPPDRAAYNTIEAATTAVQGYVSVFKGEIHTDAEIAQMKTAYAKFQAVALAANDLASKGKGADALALVNQAAQDFLVVYHVWHPEAK